MAKKPEHHSQQKLTINTFLTKPSAIGHTVDFAVKALEKPPYVVAIPTETVYGLAARIDSQSGLNSIFSIKERPFFDPLIVHVASIEQAKTLVTNWDEASNALAKKFWPGPLTLVLDKSLEVSDLITSGWHTVGIRMPDHPLTLQLIETIRMPLAAPSANKFGRTSPTTAGHVNAEFGGFVSILDGGACQVGVESTVLRVAKQKDTFEISQLRPGFITRKVIEDCLKASAINFEWQEESDTKGPGQLKRHYMPKVPLVYVRSSKGIPSLNKALQAEIFQEFLALPKVVDGVQVEVPDASDPKFFESVTEIQLPSNPALAARKLYSTLRDESEKNPSLLIFFEKPLHLSSAWEAIQDRLTKAATVILK